MRGLGEDETRKGREGGRKMSNERRMGKRGGKEWGLGGRDEEEARRSKEGGGSDGKRSGRFVGVQKISHAEFEPRATQL